MSLPALFFSWPNNRRKGALSAGLAPLDLLPFRFPFGCGAFLIVSLFMLLAWDIVENTGHYTHTISSEIGDIGHQLGL